MGVSRETSRGRGRRTPPRPTTSTRTNRERDATSRRADRFCRGRSDCSLRFLQRRSKGPSAPGQKGRQRSGYEEGRTRPRSRAPHRLPAPPPLRSDVHAAELSGHRPPARASPARSPSQRSRQQPEPGLRGSFLMEAQTRVAVVSIGSELIKASGPPDPGRSTSRSACCSGSPSRRVQKAYASRSCVARRRRIEIAGAFETSRDATALALNPCGRQGRPKVGRHRISPDDRCSDEKRPGSALPSPEGPLYERAGGEVVRFDGAGRERATADVAIASPPFASSSEQGRPGGSIGSEDAPREGISPSGIHECA